MNLHLDFDPRRAVVGTATIAASLAVTTLLVAALQTGLGVANASAAYLLAVVVVAVLLGTIPAAATAVAAFLLYDFLFIEPKLTFTVANPDEWVNLVLLLVVGMIVGQLAAGQRNRAEAAEIREREARVLFRISRALATRADTAVALTSIVDALRDDTGSTRVRIVLGADPAGERVTADSSRGAPYVRPASYAVLRRMPGETPSAWVRVHDPAARSRRDALPAGTVRSTDVYRVPIEAGGQSLGAVWAQRAPGARAPNREETRMLAAAADQIGQVVEQDRLREEATSAELARRSDALKTALLDSVSHDLRTPLASIRAAAGSLMDEHLTWSPGERRDVARTIDLEAERLNRLVTNLLDMSRIEAGGLRAELEPFPLDDLVRTTIQRLGPHARDRRIEVQVAPDLPLVMVDPTFMDQILTNVVENALKYAPEPAPIRISALALPGRDAIRLTVEDGGMGVPDEALPRLFDKFFRVPRRGEGPRRGTGVGLAVVRGLAETMHGSVDARRSALGGLAVDIDLPRATDDSAADAAARVASVATSDAAPLPGPAELAGTRPNPA